MMNTKAIGDYRRDEYVDTCYIPVHPLGFTVTAAAAIFEAQGWTWTGEFVHTAQQSFAVFTRPLSDDTVFWNFVEIGGFVPSVSSDDERAYIRDSIMDGKGSDDALVQLKGQRK